MKVIYGLRIVLKSIIKPWIMLGWVKLRPLRN
jgi:hypothetical protein